MTTSSWLNEVAVVNSGILAALYIKEHSCLHYRYFRKFGIEKLQYFSSLRKKKTALLKFVVFVLGSMTHQLMNDALICSHYLFEIRLVEVRHVWKVFDILLTDEIFIEKFHRWGTVSSNDNLFQTFTQPLRRFVEILCKECKYIVKKL